MPDVIVADQMRRKGITIYDENIVFRIQAMDARPRVLDKAPKKIGMKKASEIIPFGCTAEFIMLYNEILPTVRDVVPQMDIKGNRRVMDKEIYAALLTLIKAGCTCTADRAAACFSMFKLLSTVRGDTITRDRVYKALTLNPPNGVWEKALYKALMQVLYGVKPPVLYWLELIEFSNLYPEVVEEGKKLIEANCPEEKDVKTYINALKEEMLKDEEFVKTINKKTVNRYLAPMVWKCRDVLHESQRQDGFA